jgi:hypothetical protein
MRLWIRKKVLNFLNSPELYNKLSIVPTDVEKLYSEGLSVRVYSATGGTVVEFRRYDNHKDKQHNKLYVISSEQNFSEQFSKIVSMEMIR